MNERILDEITVTMIKEMQHCIGFTRNKVTGTKHRVMHAYRNHYCDQTDNVIWNKLVKINLAKKGIEDSRGLCFYWLTEDGFKFLATLCGFEKIIEID